MIVMLQVGDWSLDGHEKVEDFYFETNAIDKVQVINGFSDGAKILGFDISRYCEEYEDCEIPTKAALRFQSLLLSGTDTEKESKSICPQEFVNIWVHTVTVGNPSIRMTPVTVDAVIPVGGYGLFY